MNAEQIADELITQRPYTAKPFGRRWRQGGIGRWLTVAEVCEFRAGVSAALKARCTPAAPCWEPGCERCGPA